MIKVRIERFSYPDAREPTLLLVRTVNALGAAIDETLLKYARDSVTYEIEESSIQISVEEVKE